MKDKWVVMIIGFIGAGLFYLGFCNQVGSRLDEMILMCAMFVMVTAPSIIYGLFAKDEKNNEGDLMNE